jgi:hypothetical protein
MDSLVRIHFGNNPVLALKLGTYSGEIETLWNQRLSLADCHLPDSACAKHMQQLR